MEHIKICSLCKEAKSINLFYKDKRKKDGHRYECKVCLEAKARLVSSAIRQEKYRSKPDKKAKIDQYNIKNQHKKQNISASHRSKNAYVSWANRHKCEDFYKNAIAASKWTGLKFEVDHRVPLKGMNEKGVHVVCGLHNEYNLHIVTRQENLKKSNKLWEFMWNS